MKKIYKYPNSFIEGKSNLSIRNSVKANDQAILKCLLWLKRNALEKKDENKKRK
jgi:hypothetical protein